MRGKVPYAGNGSRHSGDHPRMCGEKTWTPCKPSMMLGSPPHVRGKDAQNNPTSCPSGITPACAGKSVKWSTNRSASEDHPRMCGEKVPIDLCVGCHVGSPPHVRGKGTGEIMRKVQYGITPACAGKSAVSISLIFRSRDHPRMCGEKCYAVPDAIVGVGSPPHVRGKD